MGLSPDQLRNALAAANVTSPQGFLSDGKTVMAVSANDALHTADDFADVVISAKNGVPVRLKDVANVYDGQQDQYQAAWYGTERAILMFVRKQADANVIETVDSIKNDVPVMQAWLPAGVTLTPFFDRTPIIRASIDEVQISLADFALDGGADDGAVPAPPCADADRGNRGAAFARERVRDHVHPRLTRSTTCR